MNLKNFFREPLFLLQCAYLKYCPSLTTTFNHIDSFFCQWNSMSRMQSFGRLARLVAYFCLSPIHRISFCLHPLTNKEIATELPSPLFCCIPTSARIFPCNLSGGLLQYQLYRQELNILPRSPSKYHDIMRMTKLWSYGLALMYIQIRQNHSRLYPNMTELFTPLNR